MTMCLLYLLISLLENPDEGEARRDSFNRVPPKESGTALSCL